HGQGGTQERLPRAWQLRRRGYSMSTSIQGEQDMPQSGSGPSRQAPFDRLLQEIADYTLAGRIDSREALGTARYWLLDALGCGLLALGYPACAKLIGPVVPEAILPGGARVPGTPYELDPVQAAFCIGAMVRWLDFNDTWLAAEWGHPSDNLGG